MIVLQPAVNEATFKVLYNPLIAIKMQVSRGCVSCLKDVSISGDVINDAKVT